MNLAISYVLFAIFIALKLIVSLSLSHPDGVTGSVLCKLATGGNLAWNFWSFFSRYFGCDCCRKILFCGVSTGSK